MFVGAHELPEAHRRLHDASTCAMGSLPNDMCVDNEPVRTITAP